MYTYFLFEYFFNVSQRIYIVLVTLFNVSNLVNKNRIVTLKNRIIAFHKIDCYLLFFFRFAVLFSL